MAGILSAQRLFAAGRSAEAFQSLLDLFLGATGSAYGFVGEILLDAQGQRFLQTRSLTNISWDDATRALYAQAAAGGLAFRNLDTLFGAVIRSGEPLIANDAAHHPRARGVPYGHPPLARFMGLPLYFGDEYVGMVGVANREEPYDDALIDALLPVLLTTAQLIHAHRVDRARLAAEDALRQRADLNALLTRAASAFIVVNEDSLDGAIDDALGELGAFVGADRAYLFQFHGERRLSNTHEWCAAGIDPQKDFLQDQPLAEFSDTIGPLEAGETLHIPDVDALPDDAGTKASLQAQAIRSLVLLPMIIGGTTRGFLGFDAVRAARHWDDDSVALLKVAASAMGAALDRAAAQRAARAREALLASITENIDVGIRLLDATTGAALYRNPAARRAWPEDAPTLPDGQHEIAVPDADPAVPPRLYRVHRLSIAGGPREGARTVELAHDITLEREAARRLEADRDALEEAVALRTADLAQANESLRVEMAERARAQQAMADNEALFRTLAETSPVAVVVVDRDQGVLYANPATSAMVGLAPSLLPGVPATLIRDAHGRPLADFDVSAHDIRRREVPLVRADGSRLWLDLTTVPVRFGHRDALLVAGVDITRRRDAEAEARGHLGELSSRTRTTVLAELSSSLAHELNQPLAAITGWSEGAILRLDNGQTTVSLRPALSAVADEAARASQIVRRLRALFQRERTIRAHVSLNDVVSRVWQLFAVSFEPAGVEGELHLDPSAPAVQGDAGLLEIVLYNLLRNGLDAMAAPWPGPRRLEVGTRREGATALAWCRDSGHPLDPAAIRRMYDSWFDTRSDGSGMGLFISRSIAERHGGALAVLTPPDGTKVFSLTLPLSPEAP